LYFSAAFGFAGGGNHLGASAFAFLAPGLVKSNMFQANIPHSSGCRLMLARVCS